MYSSFLIAFWTFIIFLGETITELFNREKFDVLHAHMNTLSYITPVIEALKSGCKVIVHSRSAGMAGSKTTNMLHHINSYLLPGDRIEKLAVSDLAGWWLFGKNADFKVIYNGIDLELYRFDPELRRKTRSSLGLSNQYTVIHVGAMRPLKNHFFLLDVFKEVAERKEGSKLILVGEGPLKADILNKINFLGLRNKVMLLGNRIDKATGLPCLISDNITSDVIINSNCFSYSLNLTPNIWADALLKLNVLENRQIAVENLAQKGFSVKDEVCKIEDIYNNLLQ